MMENTPPPTTFSAPPSFQAPPPVITPPPQARPPRRWGWIIISVILFLLLCGSLLLNVGNFFSGMASVGGGYHTHGGPKLDEVVVEEGSGKDKIAVISIEGIIMGGRVERGHSMVDVIKAQLDRADEDKHVKAVVLRVDSPGGEVLASDEIANYITDFQESSSKPVVVSMGSLAASGGYYVSAPCDWIVANELTITGSIGVIMHGYNYRGLMNKIGLKPTVYKSGKFKNMLSGDREDAEIPPEEHAMMQKFIDETYGKFKQVVADGRTKAHKNNSKTKALANNWADFADGRILSGKEAVEVGLVDELGDFQTAVSQAENLGGISGAATLVEYRPRPEFGDLFSLFGRSEAKSVKLDLGVELPKIEAGRAYFLAPTYLH